MTKASPSFWVETTPETSYPTPRPTSLDVDVAVVGAGITGHHGCGRS